MEIIDEETAATGGSGLPRSKWPYLAAAAVVAVLAVAIGFLAADEDDNVAAGPASTTADAGTPSGAETALAVADDYFDAFNSGDADALFALLTPDADPDDNLPSSALTNRAVWELSTVWHLAQGSTLTTPQCEVTDEVRGSSATVSCKTTHIDAAMKAADSDPVRAIITFVVAPAGISDLLFTYGATDFSDVGVPFKTLRSQAANEEAVLLVDFTHASDPFERWLTRTMPDVDGAISGGWTTREEAEQHGVVRAELARQWADYLAANNCNYLDNC